eukprot:scaffold22799_cov21-Tisochrysis_lutea.AAC.1
MKCPQSGLRCRNTSNTWRACSRGATHPAMHPCTVRISTQFVHLVLSVHAHPTYSARESFIMAVRTFIHRFVHLTCAHLHTPLAHHCRTSHLCSSAYTTVHISHLRASAYTTASGTCASKYLRSLPTTVEEDQVLLEQHAAAAADQRLSERIAQVRCEVSLGMEAAGQARFASAASILGVHEMMENA